jgi:hypothetical protein
MLNPNLIVITEGQTETKALPALLSNHLRKVGLEPIFTTIGRPGTVKGGRKSFETLIDYIRLFAKQYPGCHISTFFDYYGLNTQWPGVNEAKTNLSASATRKVDCIEIDLAWAVTDRIGTNILWDGHFLPYVQLHEFEALLLALPDTLASIVLSPSASDNSVEELAEKFREISSGFFNCELINDSPATAPSKRIEALCGYRKGKSHTAHAWQVLRPEYLPTIRLFCPRFDSWLIRLEALIEPQDWI